MNFITYYKIIITGSFNDAGIFNNSDLGRGIAQELIDLPASTLLPNSNILSPYFLIADGGFGIKKYLMRPYVRNDNLPKTQKIFNFCLSHARIVIENAFGELSQTWLVNENTLSWKLSTIEIIITSTICLHNYLIDMKLNEVFNRWNRIHNVLDNNVIPVDNQHVLPELGIRQRLTEYFISNEGAVEWQWDRI